MKISNETKVGALTAIAITLLILGYNYMSGKQNLFGSSNVYYSVYENIDGLQKSNAVSISGYKIGQVTNIVMQKDLRILIEVTLNSDISITKGSQLKIISTSPLGGKGIELVLNKSAKEYCQNGDTLYSDFEPSITQSATKILAPMSEKIDSILTSLEYAIGGDELKNSISSLKTTLDQFAQVASIAKRTLAKADPKLNSILANVDGITKNLDANNANITSSVNNIKTFSDNLTKLELSKTIAQLNATMKDISGITTQINKGNGTMTKLIKDPRLYDDLDKAIKDLDALILKLKDRPVEFFPRLFPRKDRKK